MGKRCSGPRNSRLNIWQMGRISLTLAPYEN